MKTKIYKPPKFIKNLSIVILALISSLVVASTVNRLIKITGSNETAEVKILSVSKHLQQLTMPVITLPAVTINEEDEIENQLLDVFDNFITTIQDGNPVLVIREKSKDFIMKTNPQVTLKSKEFVKPKYLEPKAVLSVYEETEEEFIYHFGTLMILPANPVIQNELLKIVSTEQPYSMRDFYIDGRLCRTTVKTPEVVLSLQFDRNGEVEKFTKRERNISEKRRIGMYINKDYLAQYDKIEKFENDEFAND